MRARVWTAGVVEANMQQTSSDFQDSDNLWVPGRAVKGGFWGWVVGLGSPAYLHVPSTQNNFLPPRPASLVTKYPLTEGLSKGETSRLSLKDPAQTRQMMQLPRQMQQNIDCKRILVGEEAGGKA
eukprot:1149267-Pelagomonas_calceolata.AAC.2